MTMVGHIAKLAFTMEAIRDCSNGPVLVGGFKRSPTRFQSSISRRPEILMLIDKPQAVGPNPALMSYPTRDNLPVRANCRDFHPTKLQVTDACRATRASAITTAAAASSAYPSAPTWSASLWLPRNR